MRGVTCLYAQQVTPPLSELGPTVCVSVVVAGLPCVSRVCGCMDLCLGRLEGIAKGSELSKDWFSHLADLKISLAAFARLIHAFRANARSRSIISIDREIKISLVEKNVCENIGSAPSVSNTPDIR